MKIEEIYEECTLHDYGSFKIAVTNNEEDRLYLIIDDHVKEIKLDEILDFMRDMALNFFIAHVYESTENEKKEANN